MKRIIVLACACILLACGGSDDTPQQTSCNNPSDLQGSSGGPISAQLNWTVAEENASNYTIELGVQGFQLGMGTQFTTANMSYSLSNLTQNTTYDFYVRTNCVEDISSDFSGPSTFTTQEILCEKVTGVAGTLIMADSVIVFWDEIPAESYEIEYGEAGFTLGSGTNLTVAEANTMLENLTADTSYDVYVRAICGNDVFGDYAEVYQFTTQPICRVPLNFRLFLASQTSVIVAWDSAEPTVQIEYGPVGFVLGTGTVINTSGNNTTITGLTPNTVYESYIRANCGSNGFSEWSDNLVFATNP